MDVQGIYIDGSWVSAPTTFEVRNPADPSQVRHVGSASAEQITGSVAAAKKALRSTFGPEERSATLGRLAALIAENREDLAQTITFESGKAITAARAEVDRAATTIRLASEEARRLPGERVQLPGLASSDGDEPFAFTVPAPVGVVAAITPFNFPLNLVAHKVAPALAAGCPVVLKPSERTPLTAGALVSLAEQAGLPPGWLNLVTGDPGKVVNTWVEHADVAVISFTGSAEVGWAIRAQSPTKRHVLELGSCTALVVDASADVESAVQAAVAGGYTFSGQACISVQRVIVHDDVFEEFLGGLVSRVSAMRCGSPTDDATVVGPVISAEAAERISLWTDEAVAGGATLHCGGRVDTTRVDPIVLSGAAPDALVEQREVFGPLVSVTSAATLDEAIERANSTRYGLNTSIYTRDLGAALRYAREAEAGAVFVNVPPSFRADNMPYGGVKESGLGREGVAYAVAELLEQKLVVLRA